MKAITQRIRRLENQIRPLQKAPRFRITVQGWGGEPGPAKARCQRSVWPDGTIFELIRFLGHAYDELQGGSLEAEFEAWIDSIPTDGVPREFAARPIGPHATVVPRAEIATDIRA
jgi:hypothetical protein